MKFSSLRDKRDQQMQEWAACWGWNLRWVNQYDVAVNPLGEMGHFRYPDGRNSPPICLTDLRSNEDMRALEEAIMKDAGFDCPMPPVIL